MRLVIGLVLIAAAIVAFQLQRARSKRQRRELARRRRAEQYEVWEEAMRQQNGTD